MRFVGIVEGDLKKWFVVRGSFPNGGQGKSKLFIQEGGALGATVQEVATRGARLVLEWSADIVA